MLYLNRLTRTIYTSSQKLAAEKSVLAVLRKKTGYTIANCKKALDMHDNDLSRAELWLKEQAQALGWSKATKLEGRQTAQGLIGVAVKGNNGVMVEVNCETDFVARNKEFQKFVEAATTSFLRYTESNQILSGNITKVNLNSDQLKELHCEGIPLADKLALMIGSVGENVILKKGVSLSASNNIYILGYAHPSGPVHDNNVLYGKLGGLLAYRSHGQTDHTAVARGICQHIVGMRPLKVGTPEDKPASNKDEEVCLLHQEYLLDDSLTVREVLQENALEVIGFERLECGEAVAANTDPLELVERCQ